MDIELIRQAREGNAVAQERIFRHFQRRIYNFILNMVNSEEDAADLTQDVFVRLFETLPELRAEEAFTSYLYTIATNACRDFARRRRRVAFESLDAPRSLEGEDSEPSEIPDTADNPQEKLERQELQARVRAAIETLSPDHRAVIIMHHLQEMEVAEIANIMNVRVGTIKSRLARARNELKRKLQGYLK